MYIVGSGGPRSVSLMNRQVSSALAGLTDDAGRSPIFVRTESVA